MSIGLTVSITASLLLAVALGASAGPAGAPHPQGKVVFQDDLEKGVTFAPADAPGWHESYQSENVSVEDDPKIAHSGRKCLRIHVPNRDGGESGGYYSIFLPEPYGDVTWVSYWIRYAADFDQNGAMHCGEVVINDRNGAPGAWFASAGHDADGTNFAKSWAETENSYNPTTPPGYVVATWRYANLQYEAYWTGTVPERGTWHHVVFKIRLNDPDKANGYMDLWYDDQLLGHFYGQHSGLDGIVMRKTPNLVVRAMYPGAYIHKSVRDNTLWLDDITVTTGGEAPPPPSNLHAESNGEVAKLTWEAVPGAKGYNVYRSDTRRQFQSRPFVLRNASPTKAPRFEDTGVPGPDAAWLVTAIMPDGESAFSKEARLPQQAPAAEQK